MLILQNILSQEIVQRLGWTLLHFIWQAAAVALILAILLRVLRKSTANLRYIIACLALALIVLLPIITIKLVPVSKPLTAAHFTPAPAPTVLPIEEMPAPETIVIAKPYQSESVPEIPAIPFKQRAVNALEPALPYIVSGWLIGVFGLSIWHLGGWTQLQRLKRRMVKQVDSILLNKLKALIQKLKVKQTVQLMESALVQIPTVVGWLRPVILLPASALTGLTSEQLEAIIAHELAHIKRLDYLINILQTVVEILGFYHPAVWWVSYKIRAERENCCDDLAVSISGDCLSYAGTLVSMEEIRAAGGKLAVAAAGGNLFRRICRLLGKDSTDNTGISWVPAATAILLIIALAIPTTLALTNKTDSLLTKTKTDIQVEDDISIETSQDEESSATDSKETSDTQIEDKRVLSAHKLKLLGLAVAMYASDHDKKLPDTLEPLKPYIANEQDYLWLRSNAEYVLNEEVTKYQPSRPNIPVAYDKTQEEQQSGTNVLFLDGHVEFLTPQRLSELDIKRAEILIDAMFLSVSEDFLKSISLDANSPDEAKDLFKLQSELLAAVDGSNKSSFILSERNLSLLLKAVRSHKDSKVLAHPKVLTREGTTAEISVINKETYYIVDYNEPNSPSEKPQPKLDKVEEGITMSLRPKLTPKKYIDMQFKLEVIRVPGFEEKMYKGKYPYKLPSKQLTKQGSRYIAKDGQTLLFGGNKITDQQDGQTEQKDLLVLIKAQTVDSSEQDKPAKAENPIVTEEPPTTTKVISPPPVAKSSIERPKDNKQEKTKTNEIVTEIFKLRYGEPVEIVEVLKKLINGRPDTASVIESSNGPILLIPEPKRKWIIAKASPENINQIGQWIKKLDTEQTIGMDPIDATVYEQLDTIVNLSDLAPQMSFAEVIEMLENSVEPPLQIQPIWKDLLDNAEIEQTTPADMDPLPHIKLRKALEILLTSVSSTGLPKLTYVVDEGVILIGTEGVLPPKIVPRAYDISDPNELRMITEHKQQPSQLQPKIAKLPDESKKRMTPLEQIQKQLDELIKQRQAPKVTEPNLPMDPNVLLISNTFIDCPLIDALQSIAAAANVTIIPAENVKGLITCKLKDVTVETALDIILAGTPYVWKKTPQYYLVASEIELPGIKTRMESAKKLSNLGKALLIYANDNDKYPNSLFTLSKHMKWQDFSWIRQNAEYLASGKTLADRPDIPIAYDKTLLTKGKGTNVLYNDCHVGFVKAQELKKLGISESEIMIETKFLSVSEDYLKDVGLDANTENFSDAWTKLLASKYPTLPNGQPYGLFIDDLHVRFLLRAVQADHGSKALVTPRVLTRAGTTAEMRFTTEEYNYISGYNEPQDPSDQPEPKLKKVDIGTRIWLTPKLTDDNRNVNLYLKLEMRQLKDIIEGKYKEKYSYYKPVIDVISAKMPCTIPKGKTMLIGGLKLIKPIIKESGTPGLKDLPLIGAAFSSKDKPKDQKMLLILVKPIINPQEKATKIRPGQDVSEEHIKHLAEQLDKKINPSGKPRQ